MPGPILNISAYRFVPLADLQARRADLHAAAEARGLKGTVLLAAEGLNLFLAGAPDGVRGWLDTLRADPAFADLQAKESWSATLPFKRLKVKIKREVIRMDRPAIRPSIGRAPALSPEHLARWLASGRDDDGRDVVMLDTRNAFEVDAGAFEQALDWRLQRFSDFPAALERHVDALRDKTVVSYCTGGIRCEKAALAMREAGLEHVWQLDGGVLMYFERMGRTAADGTAEVPHWRGRCFVFDERELLDPALRAVA